MHIDGRLPIVSRYIGTPKMSMQCTWLHLCIMTKKKKFACCSQPTRLLACMWPSWLKLFTKQAADLASHVHHACNTLDFSCMLSHAIGFTCVSLLQTPWQRAYTMNADIGTWPASQKYNCICIASRTNCDLSRLLSPATHTVMTALPN